MRKSLLFLLFLLPFCAFATSITGIKADGDTKVFNLDDVVSIKDGTEVKYLATDIDSIRIENFTAIPADQTGLEFYYNKSTMTATVAGPENENKDIKEVKIPSQVYYDGNVYDVTTIEEYAFSSCTSLTSIEIPNSVTEIGKTAFGDCTSLTSLVIGNSVTSIGDFAFWGCSSLTSIVIPNSVTEIGKTAFYGCKSLTSIEIPNSVTSIGKGAFSGCTSLTSIVIPNSVTSIGGYAFEACKSLTSIEIPNSVTSIGDYAFRYCKSLTSIVVDKGNKVYDSRENCNAIIETASNTLIAGCQNTVIPNSVTSIGQGAFSGCTSLTSIEIPNLVTKIGHWAFESCTSLTSIVIPNSVTEIGWGAFRDCSSLKTVRVPVSLKGKIGSAYPPTCKIEWY